MEHDEEMFLYICICIIPNVPKDLLKTSDLGYIEFLQRKLIANINLKLLNSASQFAL